MGYGCTNSTGGGGGGLGGSELSGFKVEITPKVIPVLVVLMLQRILVRLGGDGGLGLALFRRCLQAQLRGESSLYFCYEMFGAVEKVVI